MGRRVRTLLCAAVSAVAMVAAPVHAHADTPEPTTVELRIELHGESGPDVAAGLTPGGSADLVGFVSAIGETEIDPSQCRANLSTSPDGTQRLTVGGCAGSDFAASVDVAGATATVNYEGQVGDGAAKLSFGTWGAIIAGVIIVAIIIVILI